MKLVNTSHVLHSHRSNYPDGSQQQQVTCSNQRDDNDWWRVLPELGNNDMSRRYVQQHQVIRFEHVATNRMLHSHNLPSHVATDQQEVSCYGTRSAGDHNDNWRVLYDGERGTLVLQHVETGKNLHSHDCRYPDWAGRQWEVTCFHHPNSDDDWDVVAWRQ